MSNPSTKSPAQSLKRKAPPNSTPSSSKTIHKKPKYNFHQDFRAISSQTSGKAFGNGSLDVDKFVRAREFEIKALEDGMTRAKKGLRTRAFQGVPRDLRRRTASHNMKRVPKRLQARAAKEMAEDNTPSSTSKKRKLNSNKRLRLDTVRKLKGLGAKRRAAKEVKYKLPDVVGGADATQVKDKIGTKAKTKTRIPKIKANKLSTLPIPAARFRKRQIHKAWLPTHLFHAKRARMTPPSAPLWRMAIPLSPTQKGYRSTHRATVARGAVAWDMSYISTISLEGRESSIVLLLKAMGVGKDDGSAFWERSGKKWMRGTRTWSGWLYHMYDKSSTPVAPVTIIWAAVDKADVDVSNDKIVRKMFIRVHPSAFIETWEMILVLAKAQPTPVKLEDLRFEIGSIEIMGPASMEALSGVLHSDAGSSAHPNASSELLPLLANTTSPSVLPPSVLMAMNVKDPRLSQRKSRQTVEEASAVKETHLALLKILTEWPLDDNPTPSHLFSRTARLTARRQMPSQKAINRRRTLASFGSQPESRATDPTIPALMFASRPVSSGGSGSYTLLLPWKYILPFWYCLMHQPLSSGGTPRFGGLTERRQVTFENGGAWFPGDFPGTKSGVAWEEQETVKRHEEWKSKPRGKRVAWDSLDLGVEKKGEIGIGWACDWDVLVKEPSVSSDGDVEMINPVSDEPATLRQLPNVLAHSLITSPESISAPEYRHSLATIKLTPITTGVPTTCARIYRLPTDSNQRQQWLSLLPSSSSKDSRSTREVFPLPSKPPKDAPPHVHRQHLATNLLNGSLGDEVRQKPHPRPPGKDDLIGFVTTGNFNLSQGRGFGIGSIVLHRALTGETRANGHGRLCIVRNAGQTVGRLARWTLI